MELFLAHLVVLAGFWSVMTLGCYLGHIVLWVALPAWVPCPEATDFSAYARGWAWAAGFILAVLWVIVPAAELVMYLVYGGGQ